MLPLLCSSEKSCSA